MTPIGAAPKSSFWSAFWASFLGSDEEEDGSERKSLTFWIGERFSELDEDFSKRLEEELTDEA
jgi:hypothetical protein